MTKLKLCKVLGLTLGCAALVLGAIYARAEPKHSHGNGEAKQVHAHAGTTFILSADGSHQIDGVVQISPLGDCTFHATANLVPTATPGYYLITGGAFLITTAGGDTLTATAEGSLTFNPVNPSMADFQYDVTFTGGSGPLAGAHGSAKLHDGLLQITMCDLVQPGGDPNCNFSVVPAGATTGKACWLLDGDLDY